MSFGFTIGIQHAFEPDHVAAVSTQISQSKFKQKSTKSLLKELFTKTSILGVLWGAGHTTTLVLIGFLVYVLTITISEQVFSGLEFVVGLMLVFLGLTTILNKKLRFKHKHPHQHSDGSIHFDEHHHDNSNHNHSHRSYFIGMVHGLAGSGSLVVLTSSTLNDVGMVLTFITIFGIGSIIGMALVGSLVGIPLVFANKIKLIQKTFKYVAGGLSLIIGFNILYQIGIVGNLLGF